MHVTISRIIRNEKRTSKDKICVDHSFDLYRCTNDPGLEMIPILIPHWKGRNGMDVGMVWIGIGVLQYNIFSKAMLNIA